MRLPRYRIRTLMIMVCMLLSFLVLLFGGFVFAYREFGVSPAMGLVLILVPPLIVVARMCHRRSAMQGRDLLFLGVVFCVTFGGAAYVVQNWYDTGMDRDHAEDVKWTEFERLMVREPAFRDVRIKLTARKHIYWAEGTVTSEADLDRLRSLASRCGIEGRLDGPFAHSISLTTRVSAPPAVAPARR